MLKLHEEHQRRLADRELQIELTRGFMALFANSNRDQKKKPAPYLPQDFYKLSYDTQLVEEADPELFSRVARRLGSEIKKKKGDE